MNEIKNLLTDYSEANTSGNGPTTVIPQSISGFNWGALVWTWIWALGNKSLNTITVVLFILTFVPWVGAIPALALCIYSGTTGNERAWRNKRWVSVAQFKATQRRWGYSALILVILLSISLSIAIPIFRAHTAMARARACQVNLRQIKNVAQLWALENRKSSSDSVDVNALSNYFKDLIKIPTCPAGGNYTAPFTPGTTPTCSLGGTHKLD